MTTYGRPPLVTCDSRWSHTYKEEEEVSKSQGNSSQGRVNSMKFINARLHYAEHEFPLPTNSLSTSKLTMGGNRQW